ncbi:hypothetical protein BJ138DRAFT_1183972 [Hygrophoropsis aurantiaca]|uniref:Uncharacterized protein n=1 Tax=Hygrophoropsis aurantiaca TaxID=72124 RepID=A0ACB7ZUH4_9AGAM|nr:hypothetical protein BJ138DRAFT_1183972 [Hygrophoropsis aurantiaca]
MMNQNATPVDVLYKIFVHLDVIDLIRLQQVSASLYSVLQDRSVWSDAFRISSLPRSKGPFPWQSASYLKSALITQAKLKQNWPPRPEILARIATIVVTFNNNQWVGQFELVLGRWLIFVLHSEVLKVCCYDIHSQLSSQYQHVIYEVQDTGAQITHLACADVATVDGQFVFVAFVQGNMLDANADGPEDTLKIYKMTLSARLDAIFELVLDIPYGPQSVHLQVTAQALLIVGRASARDYYEKTWIMDIQTYRVYRLPPPEASPELDRRRALGLSVRIFIGTTHIFVVHTPMPGWGGYYNCFAEAYPVCQLFRGELTRPSHRSSIPHVVQAPKRWSIHDLPDGSSSITLMAGAGSHIALVRLTLASSSSPPPPDQTAQLHFDSSFLEGLSTSDRRKLCDSIGGDDQDRRILCYSINRHLRGHRYCVDETKAHFCATPGLNQGSIPVNTSRIRYNEAEGCIVLQESFNTLSILKFGSEYSCSN